MISAKGARKLALDSVNSLLDSKYLIEISEKINKAIKAGHFHVIHPIADIDQPAIKMIKTSLKDHGYSIKKTEYYLYIKW